MSRADRWMYGKKNILAGNVRTQERNVKAGNVPGARLKKTKENGWRKSRMIREYEERREIEKFYDHAKKAIKEKIEMAGVSCKGSAKGQAVSEIISVLDDEMCIGLSEEMINARKNMRIYCRKFNDIESLEREYQDKKKKLEEQEAVSGLVSMLTDEVLKNAILAYNAIKDSGGRFGNGTDAKEIAIAYINSKGREDLENMILKGDTE